MRIWKNVSHYGFGEKTKKDRKIDHLRKNRKNKKNHLNSTLVVNLA